MSNRWNLDETGQTNDMVLAILKKKAETCFYMGGSTAFADHCLRLHKSRRQAGICFRALPVAAVLYFPALKEEVGYIRDAMKRHSTFCRLLTGLGVDEKTAAADACEMEHAVSPESYKALKALSMEALREE